MKLSLINETVAKFELTIQEETKKSHSWPKGGGKICSKGLSAAKKKYDGKWSAYAAGYASQVCKGKVGEEVEIDEEEGGLSKWFDDEWVDISRKKDGKHPECGRDKAGKGGYPKCVPKKKANSMSKKEKESASSRKRKNPDKQVSTKSKK